MAPLSPLRTFPGVAAKRSQTLSLRPSSFAAPSIWYDAVAAPQTNSAGNDLVSWLDIDFLSDGRCGSSDVTAGALSRLRSDQLGSDLRADVDAQRAALDEAAAGRRIDGGGGDALAHFDPLADRNRRIGHGGGQQLGVGVGRALQH